jgi:hypothetical protein
MSESKEDKIDRKLSTVEAKSSAVSLIEDEENVILTNIKDINLESFNYFLSAILTYKVFKDGNEINQNITNSGENIDAIKTSEETGTSEAIGTIQKMQSVLKAKKNLSLLEFILSDDNGGNIDCIAFGKCAEEFNDKLNVGKRYIVTRAKVARNDYGSYSSEKVFRLVFNISTKIKEVKNNKDEKRELKEFIGYNYHFKSSSEISKIKLDKDERQFLGFCFLF